MCLLCEKAQTLRRAKDDGCWCISQCRYREKAAGFEGSVQVAVERQRRRQRTGAAGEGRVEFVLCGFFLVVDRRGFILI